jgi:hypothetical protein
MPVGLGGAAFMRNLPQAGSYQVQEALFNRETERNDVPMAPIAFTGLGGATMEARIPNNGILTGLNLLFKGSLVVAGAGTVTAGYQWPWNTLKRLTLNANGQTALLSAEGMDFRIRRQRIFRNPREELSSAPATDTQGQATGVIGVGNPKPGVIANGTYTVLLEWQIPIIHDDESLVGALFAQSDQNYLTFRATPAQSADLFTLAGGSTATLTGTIFPEITFYDIPIVSTGDQTHQRDVVVIPNLAWLHGYLSSDLPFANTGDVRTPFIRTDGQLLAFAFYLDNGGIAQIAPTALNEARFAYGGNRKPRVFNPVEQLLSKNVRDYNGLIAPNYLVLDFEVDNPARDLVYPKGVSELAVEVNIPTATTINANARVHFVEETLFSGM